jgi:sulfur-carrier protein
MPTGTIRYWAAARAAAGTAEESCTGDVLADVVEAAVASHGQELARVLGHCTFLVDGLRAHPSTPLPDGAVIEVLPPFAGG